MTLIVSYNNFPCPVKFNTIDADLTIISISKKMFYNLFNIGLHPGDQVYCLGIRLGFIHRSCKLTIVRKAGEQVQVIINELPDSNR